uniref:Ammonium transporter AmtB-like domain-containing protein n=1 Tax=Ditylum brightwellii TaxID=49249 RepID=A0A7S4VHE7_9STRA|mmetsp:Transcript_57999/g.86162  ORF Transcript_57999/g.86162 Transcript_57999/m.86162 type:complete len:262 (-) Transcript_57999:1242-2027(-)
MASIYENCLAEYDSSTTEFVQCISDGHERNLSSLASGVDTFYLIFAGALVYFMQAGFAMLCAGSIRTKNVMNVLLWNLLDSCGGAIGFWSIGYAFAYGGDDMGGKTFIGHANFFLMDGADMEDWFFQFAFACALSSIVAGTVAERSKMQAYLCYSLFLTGFVYPVVAHAFWSTNGWLSNSASNPLWGSGVIDLAGSGPVHMTGGVTALVMALVLGPRIGRFHDSDGNLLDVPREFPPHSVALQVRPCQATVLKLLAIYFSI